MLRHLLRSPHAAGLRILGAYRTGEPGAAELTATVAPLRREGLVRGLDIAGLDPVDAVELLRLRAGGTPSAALQRALYEETEGNPLFLSELVRHLQESGVPPLQAGLGDLRRVGLPEDVRALISRRLARLSADGLEWLRGAAVIGREFEASLLEAVLGFDEDRFLEALEEALDARLIAEAPGAHGRYMFSHALVRETLYGGTSSARRLRMHHRVGLALEDRAAIRSDGETSTPPTRSPPRARSRRSLTTSPAPATRVTPSGRSPTRWRPASRRPTCSPTRRPPSTTPARSRCSTGRSRPAPPASAGCRCCSSSARRGCAAATASRPGRRSGRRRRSRSRSAIVTRSSGRRSRPHGGSSSRPASSSRI